MEDKLEWALILLVVLALIIYAMMTFGAKPLEQPALAPAYSAVLAVSANPSYSNAPLAVSGTLTNCGAANATLRMDGNPLAYQQDGSGGITATIRPTLGTHKLDLESGPCRDTISFETRPPACANGQARSCDAGRGCPGKQTCQNNAWGPCSGPARICNPGQKVSCPLTSCIFGVTVCNACGTGWSACTAPS
mgnify:CR=1 FL=1